MAATQLTLYNNALLEVGERKLASLSENREPRRVLDDVWGGGASDNNGAIWACLAAGQWKFAKRTVELTAETLVAPTFGYSKAFSIPSDLVRTTALCSDEYFRVPLLSVVQEQGYWFADVEPIYVSYVSNDANYGGNLSNWPPEFVRYVELYLAARIVNRTTQDKEEWKRVQALARAWLKEARSGDAMEDPTKFPPPGTWTSSRLGRRAGRVDRGNRNSLIG